MGSAISVRESNATRIAFSSFAWALLLSCAAISSSGCGDDPLTVACTVHDDCSSGARCVNGECRLGGDAGVPPERLDSGVPASDAEVADRAVAEDAEPVDVGFRPDAGQIADAETADGAAADASADASSADASPPDASPADASPPDAGFFDSGFPDASAGPVARGAYTFRRLLPTGLPPTAVLTNLAITPDDATLAASERYDRLHFVAVATETHVGSVTLPRTSNESVRVDALAYGPGGAYLLTAATAIFGDGTVQARLYRSGTRGEQIATVGIALTGTNWQAIAIDPITGAIRLIGYRDSGGAYLLTLYDYDDNLRTSTFAGQNFVSAGCQDGAFVDDGLGGRGTVYTCGFNGGHVGVFDHLGSFVAGPNTGNTTHVAARPQGDYALGVSWSGGRLARFQQGVWTVGFSAPDLGSPSVWNIAFSDDGARALITGQYSTSQTAAILREYRHPLYSTAELTDVSIAGFALSPWLGVNGVLLYDAVWRPGGDCGYLAGGCDSPGCTRGYLIAFNVQNGRPCP